MEPCLKTIAGRGGLWVLKYFAPAPPPTHTIPHFLSSRDSLRVFQKLSEIFSDENNYSLSRELLIKVEEGAWAGVRGLTFPLEISGETPPGICLVHGPVAGRGHFGDRRPWYREGVGQGCCRALGGEGRDQSPLGPCWFPHPQALSCPLQA